MTTYNGHKNWTHWNVSLWIGNDEPLYRLAMECVNTSPTLDKAAKRLKDYLPAKTPDGAHYSLTAVREALRGFKS